MVIHAASVLHGERNAVELPIPLSAIESFAKRRNFSNVFVRLVQNYDTALISGLQKAHLGNGTGNTKTATKNDTEKAV